MPRAIVDDGTGLTFEFFGPSDRDQHGKIVAEYPCWFNALVIEMLEEDISLIEGIARQSLDPSSKARRLEEVETKRKALKAIIVELPNLKGDNKQRVEKALEEVGGKIAEGYFTSSEMYRGLASTVTKEVARMTERLIQLSPETMAVAVKCNIPFEKDYKITRTHAEKVYQICSRALGRDPDLEVLRKAA